MPDARTILEREVERVPLRPFTLDSFRRDVERRRRNARIRSGALGIAVTIGVAFAVARLAGVPSDVGNPTPSPSPTGVVSTVVFRSERHGYALELPASWSARPSEVPWSSGPLRADVADLILRDTGPPEVALEVGSTPIPAGMTGEAWLDREERRHARLAGLPTCEVEHHVEATIVDGMPGRFSLDCGVILVVDQGRGYVFRLSADIATDLTLREVVRSIRLLPEEV